MGHLSLKIVASHLFTWDTSLLTATTSVDPDLADGVHCTKVSCFATWSFQVVAVTANAYTTAVSKYVIRSHDMNSGT